MTTLSKKEKHLYEAADFLREKLEHSQPFRISIDFILSLHSVLYGYFPQAAGRFRTPVYNVTVTSKTFSPVPAHSIRNRLLHVVTFVNDGKVRAGIYAGFTRKMANYKELDKGRKRVLFALFCASYLHHQITLIHPFRGGNGRFARLILSMELARQGLYRASFPPFLNIAIFLHRNEYLIALGEADKGNLIAFVKFLAKMISYSITHEKRIFRESAKRLSN